MSRQASRQCAACNGVVVTARGTDIVHWERQDTPDLHYMATIAALQRRDWVSVERLAIVDDQIDTIDESGHVAWVDVDHGQFVVYQAPHGTIPTDLP